MGRAVGPGFLFMVGLGWQLSGYQNPDLAWLLWTLSVIWLLVALYPKVRPAFTSAGRSARHAILTIARTVGSLLPGINLHVSLHFTAPKRTPWTGLRTWLVRWAYKWVDARVHPGSQDVGTRFSLTIDPSDSSDGMTRRAQLLTLGIQPHKTMDPRLIDPTTQGPFFDCAKCSERNYSGRGQSGPACFKCGALREKQG